MLKTLTIALLIVIASWIGVPTASAQTKTFTLEELKQFDGKNGQPAYVVYKGQVHDFTKSDLWKEGNHYGLHAGQDLTDKMAGAPHGEEVMQGFPVVGVLAGAAAQPTQAEVKPVAASAADQPWYANRIKIMGMSILGWTGLLLGVFFVLTFATCFAMPWAHLPLPWKGSKLGPDPLDASGKHLTWSSIHKYFVWFTVLLGLIHGVIGFMQSWWGIYL